MIKNVRRSAAVLGAVLVLAAGCGSSRPAPVTVTQAAALDPVMLAARTTCTGFSAMRPPTLYASAEATCTLVGASLDIASFATGTARDQWVKVARQFGGFLVTGPLWAVDCDTAAGAALLRSQLAVLPPGQRPGP